MIDAFEYEESEGFFLQSSDDYTEKELQTFFIKSWQKFEFINVNPEQVKSLIEGSKGKKVWDTLVEQRKAIINAIRNSDKTIAVSYTHLTLPTRIRV